MGGTGNIIKGFEKLMNEEGIEIIKGHEVIKIISDKKKITGVQLNNQTIINSNNVICNADPPAVYEKMLNGNTNNSFLFQWKKNRMEYSMGLFVYYFGTKKKYENVEHHTIKFGNKYKEHLDDIFDKKKLNNIILKETNFYNLFETSFGYTGMNIKLPLEENWNQFEIPFYSFHNNKWTHSTINFKNRQKEKKQKFNTFLVFHSGKIIMSGMCEENMEKHYNFFRNFIESNRASIEETLV